MKAVNLIPADARRQGRAAPTGLPFLGLLGALVLVLVATVLFVVAHNRVDSRRSQLAAVQSQAARWSAAAATYTHDVSLANQRMSEISAVEALVGQRTNWSRLLSQLAAVMPAHSQLGTLNATAPSAAASSSTAGTTPAGTTSAGATSTTSNGSAIELSGCAATQSVVAQTMVNLRRITGVSKVYLSSSSASGGSGGVTAGAGSCVYPVSFSVSLAFNPPTTSSADKVSPSADTPSTNGTSGVSP